MLQTIGSLKMPKFCGEWIGSDLLHPVAMMTMRRLGNGSDQVSVAVGKAMREEFRLKLLADAGQSWFALTYGSYASPAGRASWLSSQPSTSIMR